jgi:hypothetical protein
MRAGPGRGQTPRASRPTTPRCRRKSSSRSTAWLAARHAGDRAAAEAAHTAALAAHARGEALRADVKRRVARGRSARAAGRYRLRLHHVHPRSSAARPHRPARDGVLCGHAQLEGGGTERAGLGHDRRSLPPPGAPRCRRRALRGRVALVHGVLGPRGHWVSPSSASASSRAGFSRGGSSTPKSTARRLQAELGGEIVFFCHDSDHDPRETQTTLRHRKTGEPRTLNFAFENKLQRKFSPLYLKRIRRLARQHRAPAARLRRRRAGSRPSSGNPPATVADFCLEMYRRMGLLEGIRVVRSSDPAVRRAACDVPDFFVDVPHEGEIVRARFAGGALRLARGRRFLSSTCPPTDVRQGAGQPDPRHPPALDAIGRALHALHRRRGRTSLLAPRGRAGDHFCQPRPIDRSDEAYTEIPA